MFRFKGYIFDEFFTAFDKRTDPNKDVNGKGTVERYNEIIEDELDTFWPYLEEMQERLYEPYKLLERYIPFVESMMGYDPNLRIDSQQDNGDFNDDFNNDFYTYSSSPYLITDQSTFRRNILSILTRLYSIKGSAQAYDIMFSWLGITATINELPIPEGKFDIPGNTFDMPEHTFDMACPGCSDYILELTGPAVPLTDETKLAILNIDFFNRPINARRKDVTYNGVSVVF